MQNTLLQPNSITNFVCVDVVFNTIYAEPYQIEENDDSDVGMAYTHLLNLEVSESATLYDVSRGLVD